MCACISPSSWFVNDTSPQSTEGANAWFFERLQLEADSPVGSNSTGESMHVQAAEASKEII